MAHKEKNLSLVLYPSKELVLEQGEVPKPKDDEALIAVKYTGICATDIHLWSWGQVAEIKVDQPTIMGHESSGIVLAVGKDVKNVKPGDRVTIETSNSCYKCAVCLEGNYHLCADQKPLGLPPTSGTYSRYITQVAHFVYKLPDNMSLEEGALMEPLSIAVHACRRGRVTGGDKVLICGAGPIGLLTMMTARAYGATEICVMDIRQDRLDFAKKMGADHVILADPDTEITVQRVHKSMGAPPNVTLDCCGFEATIRVAMLATKPRGVVVVVGLGSGDMKVPLVTAMWREIDIIGVNRSPNTFDRAISLVSSGAVKVKPLITHRFKLEQAIEALKFVKEGSAGIVKVLVECQKE